MKKPKAIFQVAIPESVRSIDDFIAVVRAIYSAMRWMWMWGYVATDFVKDLEATPCLRRDGKIIMVVFGMDNPCKVRG